MLQFPENEAGFFLEGEAGQLQCVATPVPGATTTAIVCHPHPLHGGTLNNKVVTTVSRTLNRLGVQTVRFNYRGVGESEGVFGQGQGEVDDLRSVIQWVREVCPTSMIWLAGFSFGALVSLKGTALVDCQQLISVAPPVGQPYFKEVPDITCPWVLIQGEEDEIIPPEGVYHWVDTLAIKPMLIKVPECGHFFHRKLVDLKKILESNL